MNKYMMIIALVLIYYNGLRMMTIDTKVKTLLLMNELR